MIAMLAMLAAVVLNASSMTMSGKVTAAIEDPKKIAEVMPASPLEQARFKAVLAKALKKLPASPEEKAKKKKELAHELSKFPVASPLNFTGADMLGLQTPASNRVEFEELEMDYGLWRIPRAKEPNGYRWQTTH